MYTCDFILHKSDNLHHTVVFPSFLLNWTSFGVIFAIDDIKYLTTDYVGLLQQIMWYMTTVAAG